MSPLLNYREEGNTAITDLEKICDIYRIHPLIDSPWEITKGVLEHAKKRYENRRINNINLKETIYLFEV